MDWLARAGTRKVLIAALAGCGLVLSLQLLGPRPGYRAAALPNPEPVRIDGIDARPEVYTLGPASRYEVIRERPLFAPDRRPPPAAPAELPVAEIPVEEPPPEPVNVALAGVVITPQGRFALVRDNLTGQMLRLREGMPLQGPQGAWTLAEIQPRQVVFAAGADGTAVRSEVALDIHRTPLPGAAPPSQQGLAEQADGQPTAMAPAEDAARAAAQSRAEEIRRRIEERRAQIRAEQQRALQGTEDKE